MKILLLVTTCFLFNLKPVFSQQIEQDIPKLSGDVGSTWKSIVKALKDVDTRYYKIQVVRKRNPETYGNAELGRLQAVSVFAARNSVFNTGNLIEVKARGSSSTREIEYIKLIWITEAIDEIKEKVEEVNMLLKKANNTE